METSQLRWIDTHCHLYAAEFEQDKEAMVQRAVDAGVSWMLLPNIDLESIPGMWGLVNKYPNYCRPMMGLHPCSVKQDFQSILDKMKSEFSSRTYIGVGETGIDLYWDKTYRIQQIEAFEQQIGWAKEFDLPVIIHSRESQDLTIDIISRYQDGSLRGIFHCFGGDFEQVKQIEALGFKVGIGGVITFKKGGLAELLPQIPLQMMVLETDSPYLAPVPFRGKRNEPAYLVGIATKVAETLGIPINEVSRITSENAEAVYGKKE
jgi:TatD DNase family protein